MFNLEAVTPYLNSGTLILTPNNRLKNKLLLAFGKQQGAADLWRTPKVQSLNEWLTERWQHYQNLDDLRHLRVVASPMVTRQLWTACLEASANTNPLVHPRLLVEQLDQAYSYLKLWRVTPQQWQAYGSDADRVRLQAWIDRFETHLASLGLMTEAQKLTLLAETLEQQADALEQRDSNAKPTVCLLNFDTLSPLHETLLARSFSALERVNSNQQPAPHSSRTECTDPAQEMWAAARWAKNHFKQNLHQSIAIIDPNLGRNRARLERVLARELEPSHHLPTSPRFTMPFNFSAGTPLALCPIVLDAINTLNWHQSKSPEDANYWLNSPFIGHAEDRDLRHWLMTQILKKTRPEITLTAVSQLLNAAGEQSDLCTSEALTLWQDGIGQLQRWPASQSGKAWASTILSSLNHFNWPGPRRLDSEEHQQVKQFLSLLEQLAEADWLNKPLTRADMMGWLKELTSRQPFQPQTPESPLQILGTLESGGLAFDRIWVLGMDDSQWPPAPNPNPLIPALLQRELNMPHASAERELAFCQSLTNNYLHAAKEVVFSHAKRDGDRELTVSPLIAHLPLSQQEQASAPGFTAPTFEWLQTLAAPPVSARELNHLRGGSGMLQKQSRCPLAAFMELRLFAKRPDPASPGLTALARGNILHQALFYFWQAKPDLSALTQEAIDQQLLAAVDAALNEINVERQARYLANEKARLVRLLRPWIGFEQQRPHFDIHSLEQGLSLTLGQLPLQLRLDRIDSIDGQWLLIDYKSGATDPKKWLGSRPEEPQLPLYAIALTDRHEPVAGIAFAELRQKDQKLLGIAKTPFCPGIMLPDAKSVGFADWPTLVNHWRESLLNLAEELMTGVTPLQFSSPQSEAYLAHLSPLLRQAEQTSLAQYFPVSEASS
ncbi:PD-(D/E)XK nuclease family protein [Simiduia curdlanivorans]|uniref:PD-(D/E)XK nuclease family protein n=1 Tax=Simiduia curdlanivorans TaxID=1492769 RepID=A0ABV8V7S5_9GAMM|nr:PD-(D/E)XK nuclease family protein [Simiduia curdlanivorans]MDN3639706.1 PD-(D/E)XK nuclease family protein [Simiduia curdlanivorans]